MEDKIIDLIADYHRKIATLTTMSKEVVVSKEAKIRYEIKIGVYRTFIGELKRLLNEYDYGD